MDMGIGMHNRQGGTIENNLIEFNGTHIQFDHGVYADGDALTVRGNIVRHNACFGLQLYPSMAGARVYNNLIYGQVRRRGIVISCPSGGGKNWIVNNTIVEDQPITIANGNGEVLENNILIAPRGEAITVDANTRDLLADYNLCQPKSAYQGPHGLSEDPRFVDPEHGLFWLRENSPAIGKGAGQYAPATDFWGRARPREQAVDLGAFAFERSLLGTKVRADWDHGWAYFRHGTKIGLPDLWELPQAKTSGLDHSP
jgi:copper-binding protein NosD